MITISISADRGVFRLVLDRGTLDRLSAARGAGESYSDVILQLWSSGEPRQGQNPVA